MVGLVIIGIGVAIQVFLPDWFWLFILVVAADAASALSGGYALGIFAARQSGGEGLTMIARKVDELDGRLDELDDRLSDLESE